MGMLNSIASIKAVLFGTRSVFGGQLRRHPHQAGRNAPCRCGSGRKYKKCCWLKDYRAGIIG